MPMPAIRFYAVEMITIIGMALQFAAALGAASHAFWW